MPARGDARGVGSFMTVSTFGVGQRGMGDQEEEADARARREEESDGTDGYSKRRRRSDGLFALPYSWMFLTPGIEQQDAFGLGDHQHVNLRAPTNESSNDSVTHNTSRRGVDTLSAPPATARCGAAGIRGDRSAFADADVDQRRFGYLLHVRIPRRHSL